MDQAETIFFLGDDALGVTLASKSRRNALADILRQSGHWLEVIPGANGLSVQYDPLELTPTAAKTRLEAALAGQAIPQTRAAKDWVIPICYAPEFALDMAHITAQTGLTRAEVIARHTSARFTVDMIGFTPGFAYLECAPALPNLARLDTPRPFLPAGSVGIAGSLCGVYALPGPGGWPIIGRTPMALFDTTRADPFCLSPGDHVRFKAICEADFRKQS